MPLLQAVLLWIVSASLRQSKGDGSGSEIYGSGARQAGVW